MLISKERGKILQRVSWAWTGTGTPPKKLLLSQLVWTGQASTSRGARVLSLSLFRLRRALGWSATAATAGGNSFAEWCLRKTWTLIFSRLSCSPTIDLSVQNSAPFLLVHRRQVRVNLVYHEAFNNIRIRRQQDATALAVIIGGMSHGDAPQVGLIRSWV